MCWEHQYFGDKKVDYCSEMKPLDVAVALLNQGLKGELPFSEAGGLTVLKLDPK